MCQLPTPNSQSVLRPPLAGLLGSWALEGWELTVPTSVIPHPRRSNVATTQEALQISTIVPSLTVDDLQKSINFYEALGFVVDDRWEENGKLLGVSVRAGKNEIGLSQDDWKKGRDRTKGVGMPMYLSTTQNVDEIPGLATCARTR